MLLHRQRMHPDLPVVGGGVKALHVVDDFLALLRRKILQRRIIGKRQVSAHPLLQATQELEHLALLVARLQPPVPMADVLSNKFVRLQASLADQLPKLRWPPVDELGAQLHNLSLVPQRADPPAHPVASLQHQHFAPGLGQLARRRQPGHSCADHQDSLLSCVHKHLDAAPVVLNPESNASTKPGCSSIHSVRSRQDLLPIAPVIHYASIKPRSPFSDCPDPISTHNRVFALQVRNIRPALRVDNGAAGRIHLRSQPVAKESVMRKFLVVLAGCAVTISGVAAASAQSHANKSGSGQLLVVFKDGHHQSFNLADIARIEFPGGSSLADSSPTPPGAPPRGHFFGKWEVGRRLRRHLLHHSR